MKWRLTNIFIIRIVAIGALFFFAAYTPVQAEETVLPTASNLTGQQLLVTVPTATAEATEKRVEAATEAVVIDTIQTPDTTTLVLRVPGQTSTQTIQSVLPQAAAPIQTDQIRRALITPNDTFYTQQWHHTGVTGSINAPLGWDVTTGSASVVIAVVDTGVDLDHPDLNDNLWVNTDEVAGNGIDDDSNGFVDDVNGYDFTTTTADPSPSPNGIDEGGDGFPDGGVNHGTHIAGIIAAEGNNAVGVSGVMWDAQIMAVQVLDDEGAGFDSDIAAGIRYAADNGAEIINLSLGGYGSTTVLQEAVTYAVSKGSLIVAAAGNDGADISANPFYPACYSDVIGVGSVGQSGNASSFSNFGSTCVDVSAPGELILSTFYQEAGNAAFANEYGLESGTSMATPNVTGVAGLLLSINPTATRSQLQELVIAASHTQPGLSAQYGIGIIDASKVSQDVLLASIKAFDSSKKKTTLKAANVYALQKPFFEWTTVEGADIAKYHVYFGKNPNANPVSAGTSQTSKKFTPTTKASGDEVAYYVRVQAESSTGALSNILTYTYIVDTVVSAPKQPAAKQVKTASKNAPQVKVSWKKVTNQNVVQYQVLRKKKGSGARAVIKKTSKASYTDKQVKKGTTYEYSVKAKDDLGNTKESKKVTVKVQ
jgi:subtilisin family serine protease